MVRKWRKRTKKISKNRGRNDERLVRRDYGRTTLLDYSEIRQLTSRYIGYVPADELYNMSPLEWRDWIIGGQDKVLDLKEKNLHAAIAYGMVEGGKRLTGMFKEIELQRHQIRGTEDEYYEENEERKNNV